MSKKFGCNQCLPLMINGTFCHETGCPNTNKIWDKEEGEWVNPPVKNDDDWDESEHDEDEEDEEDDDWDNQDEDLGGTGHGDISYSDADPGL